MIDGRTVCLYQLVSRVRLPGGEETLYQRLKRFVQFDWPDQQQRIAAFILKHVQDESELILIMDRTNWKWGQRDLNFLTLSVMWCSFSFPIAWTLLPHGGNSKTATRTALLRTVMPLLEGKRLALLADREFVGQDWFRTLKDLGIKPTIRLKADTRVNKAPVWVYFKKLQPGELRIWHCPMTVYGVQMRVLACKNAHGQTLFLAYHGWGTQAVTRYAWRWNAENMHQALKSRGFELEATRLTTDTRLSLLFGVVVLAFVWCCLSGEWLEQRTPSKRLKHGYLQKSLFRRGLDALQRALRPRSGRRMLSQPRFTQLLATFDP
ncbi:IS4 family transposase [Deinococcus alpinitundrae]|uniref:IS4 family transposase n=1 Tax=Deinococcus alpinitundrae TaxID=468913 RepID=UPI00137B3E85